MRVAIEGFAALREILGNAPATLELPVGASAGDAWSALEGRFPQLAVHAASTRLARNGRVVPPAEVLDDGDELALLPPVGGG